MCAYFQAGGGHADSNTYGLADTYCDSNGVAHGNTYSTYSYTDPTATPNTNSYGHAQTHADAEICANTKAPSHATAETIEILRV